MTSTTSAADLIKQFESLRLDAYQCPAKVWTIGWGHTESVQPGMRIGLEEAEELLRRDMEEVRQDLAGVIQVELTPGQRAALVSLCFNLRGGAARLPRIAPQLVAKLNRGDFTGAASEFLNINRANGKVLPGLTRRRQAERELFLGQQQADCA